MLPSCAFAVSVVSRSNIGERHLDIAVINRLLTINVVLGAEGLKNEDLRLALIYNSEQGTHRIQPAAIKAQFRPKLNPKRM